MTKRVRKAKQDSDTNKRLETMKRIYVARDPAATAPTWLHHPACPVNDPDCERLGCGAFSGLEVEAMIDKGWWNDIPGDHR